MGNNLRKEVNTPIYVEKYLEEIDEMSKKYLEEIDEISKKYGFIYFTRRWPRGIYNRKI